MPLITDITEPSRCTKKQTEYNKGFHDALKSYPNYMGKNATLPNAITINLNIEHLLPPLGITVHLAEGSTKSNLPADMYSNLVREAEVLLLDKLLKSVNNTLETLRKQVALCNAQSTAPHQS